MKKILMFFLILGFCMKVFCAAAKVDTAVPGVGEVPDGDSIIAKNSSGESYSEERYDSIKQTCPACAELYKTNHGQRSAKDMDHAVVIPSTKKGGAQGGDITGDDKP